MKTIKGNGFEVTYDDSEEMKNKVFDAVINWFIKEEVFIGESVVQCDSASMAAPQFLADLVDDIIRFEVEDK